MNAIHRFAGFVENLCYAIRPARGKADSARRIRPLSVGQFRRRFACEVRSFPKNVVLLGWSARTRAWYCAPENAAEHPVFNIHAPGVLKFLGELILPRLAERDRWILLCFYDGWRERNVYSADYRWIETGSLSAEAEWRGAPGEIPLLGTERFRVACFAAHRGDPSALLMPEPHFLNQDYYRGLFAMVRSHAVPWEEKQPRGCFCATNHGESTNYFPPLAEGREHPRQHFQRVVERNNLPVDVHLGRGVGHAEQMRCKYIFDIDGFVRTWDAWAWKLRSGSLVMSADSPWETFFTRQFEPWVHFVPIANDFSDLPEKLAWCQEHDDECMRIAERAGRHAEDVYTPACAADAFAEQFVQLS